MLMSDGVLRVVGFVLCVLVVVGIGLIWREEKR